MDLLKVSICLLLCLSLEQTNCQGMFGKTGGFGSQFGAFLGHNLQEKDQGMSRSQIGLDGAHSIVSNGKSLGAHQHGGLTGVDSSFSQPIVGGNFDRKNQGYLKSQRNNRRKLVGSNGPIVSPSARRLKNKRNRLGSKGSFGSRTLFRQNSNVESEQERPVAPRQRRLRKNSERKYENRVAGESEQNRRGRRRGSRRGSRRGNRKNRINETEEPENAGQLEVVGRQFKNNSLGRRRNNKRRPAEHQNHEDLKERNRFEPLDLTAELKELGFE